MESTPPLTASKNTSLSEVVGKASNDFRKALDNDMFKRLNLRKQLLVH